MQTIITNATRDVVLAERAEVARSFFARGKGLMGRKTLPVGYAMIIYPEFSIHTLFMRVPIDVLFVDRGDRIVGLQHMMPPWRPFAGVSPQRGRYVIELPAGVLAASGTQIGDALRITPPINS